MQIGNIEENIEEKSGTKQKGNRNKHFSVVVALAGYNTFNRILEGEKQSLSLGKVFEE